LQDGASVRAEKAVQFRILGPFEVTADDGTPVAVGGPKPRALLVELLLHAGTVVPADRLAAAVWGDRPPPNGAVALRAYVSRLRSALPPLDGASRLRYRAHGYELALERDELDATGFVQLVTEAREEEAAGDHGRALSLLETALALWRGDALAEFDVAALGAEGDVARLAELRLVAVEERADALLALGRAAEVVPELERLIPSHPERERLSVLLMRALYAGGRQTEALAVYRDLRHALVEELGVEPSAPTRAVHRQLLAQDPALLPTAAAQPTNLPRRGTSFVGREGDIGAVAAALRGIALVTLSGVGGVGKSRLALEVAEAERARFPDGVWLCELAPLPDGAAVGHAIASALRVQQRHALTIEETVVEYLRGRRLLLVLDNCEHVLDAAAPLVERIIAQCPGVSVLATSREALGVAGEQVWPVRPMPPIDARDLFLQRALAARPGFRPDEDAEASIAEICRRLDGLPLAIELIAARMRVMSPDELARRLDDERLRVPGTRTAQPRHQSLTAAIDWSYVLLSAPEQQLFTQLSVFAGGADLAAVHAVCGEPGSPESEVLDLLTALVDRSMAVAEPLPSGTRYWLLETLRAYGRERLSDPEGLAARHARWFTALAEEAAHGVQGPDERAWVERTMPDLDNLRVAFEFAMSHHDADLALRLVTSLPEVSQIRRGYEPAGWAERALELTSPDHPLFVVAVGAAARGAWNAGDFPRARRLAALRLARSPGPGTARSGYPADVAADIELVEGAAGPALRHYTAEVQVARASGDANRLVWCLYYVAICHAVLRQPEHGIPAAQESVAVAEATANPTARSMARYALGLVLKKSDPGRALALFDEAAALAESVHNFWWQGIALMEAAATRAVHRDPVAAGRALAVVLDHWDRVGDWTQQWLNLRYVVRLLLRLGCEEDVVVLHSALRAAGKPSPLATARVAGLLDGPDGDRHATATARGSALSGAGAVTWAREALRRAT
jgi:predicted ATPase/DNA-binding SARP family transcriptional activator